ncbi:DUF502 domain-containing protein [Thiomicrorhabdus sediminis]|uniref:DUF502 domain-containing protein n=1 Tax=Thiomicrorhabdus sediminis TaxID=2580412 RepID=A0A4P9K6A4_9GAMM|nr:DUF502 domain-containing protein [Thiomicrorhabdus sediminis]QCU90398.1 DUF502 domain-containing protein [Thiomicrorhabdus sediminis]
MAFLKRYLIAGLLVWLPLGVTFAVIKFLVDLFDQTLLLIPEHYRPEYYLGVDIPGFGLLLSVLLVLVTGVIVANFLGTRLVAMWESLLSRIPLVRSIYNAVKQIAEAVFGSGDQTFEKVYLIEYPRKDLWTLAFQTSTSRGEAQTKTGLEDVVNLFVPTTPNPTSGFFIMASRNEIIELNLSVDAALKMLISGGVVVPDAPKKNITKVQAIDIDIEAGPSQPITPARKTLNNDGA